MTSCSGAYKGSFTLIYQTLIQSRIQVYIEHCPDRFPMWQKAFLIQLSRLIEYFIHVFWQFVEFSLLWRFLAVCGFVQVACQGFLVREACWWCSGGWSCISSLWSVMKCPVMSYEMSMVLGWLWAACILKLRAVFLCCWRICLLCLSLELVGPCVVLGFSVSMEAFDELLLMFLGLPYSITQIVWWELKVQGCADTLCLNKFERSLQS